MNKNYVLAGAILLFVLLMVNSCSLPGSGTVGTTPGGSTAPGLTPSGPTNTDGAEVIFVPGGTFRMGSEATDTQADADEMPLHQVTLSGFHIYTHEVTNAMYASCVNAGGCDSITPLASGPTAHYVDSSFSENPVVGVDWNMAYDYCQWAGGRLPTEAEWELAARGTESLLYPWGAEDPTCDRVNMLGCNIPPDTRAVGTFANGNSPYKVWDMSGNAWEWVNDWYAADYYTASPASSPFGPVFGEEKVVRGGGWKSGPDNVRAAARASANLYRAYDDVGFRCVAGGDLPLPEDYVVPEDRHESVPPGNVDGGGESVEDPDDPTGWWWTWSRGAASCPADGMITVSIPLEASISQNYSLASGYGGDVPFDCTYDAAGKMLRCTGPVPEVTEGDPFYHFLMCAEEFDSCNFVDVWRAEVMLMDACAENDAGLTTNIVSACWGGPGLRSDYEPRPPTMTSLTAGGVPLDCTFWTGDDFGYTDCYDIPGEPGTLLTVSACFDSGDCLDQAVMVPRCEEPPVTLTTRGSTYCTDGSPVVQIDYRPADETVTSVTVDGTALDCKIGPDGDVGRIECADLPASHPDMVFTVCFASGVCLDTTITPAACGTPPHGFWALLDVGCHSETQIYVMMDVPLPELMMGVPYTYTVTDGVTNYTCDLHPTIPGRIYCSGTRSESAGPLQVCISVNGGEQLCNTFDEFPGLVPVCAGQPPQPVAQCSDYTTLGACTSHGCTWHLPSPSHPGGNGYCTNP